MDKEDDHFFETAPSSADQNIPNSKSGAVEKRLDLERLGGNDVCSHEKLVDIVEDVWLRVPERKLAAYTSDQWLKDVMERCRVVIDKATEKLRVGNPEERIFVIKAKFLRNGIIRQIIRAMGEISEKYSKEKTTPVGTVNSDATSKHSSQSHLPWEKN